MLDLSVLQIDRDASRAEETTVADGSQQLRELSFRLILFLKHVGRSVLFHDVLILAVRRDDFAYCF